VDAGVTVGFKGYGRIVLVQVTPDVVTLYAHLRSYRVYPGEIVGRDQLLGIAGCTGYCTGTHLHFEVRQNGRAVNPRRFLGRERSGYTARRPGRLAQLGEHQLDKLGVTGSSPVPPIESSW